MRNPELSLLWLILLALCQVLTSCQSDSPVASAPAVAFAVPHELSAPRAAAISRLSFSRQPSIDSGTPGLDRSASPPIRSVQVVQIVAFGACSFALAADGDLLAFGSNYSGSLGDGTTEQRPVPQRVLTDVKNITTAYGCAMALKGDGTLWLFGEHDPQAAVPWEGGLFPTQIAAEVCAVAGGSSSIVVVKRDGSLWNLGQVLGAPLEDGSRNNRDTSFQIMTDVAAVSASSLHALVVRKDRSLWAFGGNHHGQLGDGTITDRSEPMRVMSGIKAAEAIHNSSCAVATDGSRWSFGDNALSQLLDATHEAGWRRQGPWMAWR